MKNKKTFIGVALLLAVLMLGIGYAALSGVTLNITGKATGTPDGSNFVVDFSEKFVINETGANQNVEIEAGRTGELTAKLNVSNLIVSGESVSVTYTIENKSKDLSALLELDATEFEDESGNFLITAALGKDLIKAGESTEITVTVKLLVTPIEEVSKNFEFSVTASPKQPQQ